MLIDAAVEPDLQTQKAGQQKEKQQAFLYRTRSGQGNRSPSRVYPAGRATAATMAPYSALDKEAPPINAPSMSVWAM